MDERTQAEVAPLVGVGPVAAYLDVSPAQVYQACRDGLLPHVRLGRRIRFSPESIMEWVANGGAAHPGGWKKEV